MLNDPKVLLGADFNQIPVSIMFYVVPGSPYCIFCFVGDATQVGLVIGPYRFFIVVGNATQVDLLSNV